MHAHHHTKPSATAGLVSMATLAVGIGGLAAGIDWAWVAFPLGYGGILPLVLARERDRGAVDDVEDTDAATDPLDDLKTAYVNGEIDDATFERRLDRLMETEA